MACFACCVLGRLSAIEGRLNAWEESDERVERAWAVAVGAVNGRVESSGAVSLLPS